MNERIRIAVVGAGHLGRIHARLLSEMDDVELVAVVDPVTAARERVAADCRTQPVSDYQQLVGQIDGAVIATPTASHHAVGLDLLRHGVPLLVEKPLAPTLSEAEGLVDAAERSATLLQVGHIERFNPAFVAAAGVVTRPRYIEGVRASGFTGRSTDIGVVFDLMIHDIDLVLSLVRAPLSRVSAVGVGLLGRHEDVAQARLEFSDGSIANLSASRVSNAAAPKRQMQLWGEEGFAQIDFGNRTASAIRPCEAVLARQFDYNTLGVDEKGSFQEKLFREILNVQELAVESRNALADELRDFVTAIRTGGAPRVSGADARDAVAVAEAVVQSIRDHVWRSLPVARPTAPHILRGPHWQSTPLPHARREAG